MRRCSIFWRCLRYGCPSCDREHKKEAAHRDNARRLEEWIREVQRPPSSAPDDPSLN